LRSFAVFAAQDDKRLAEDDKRAAQDDKLPRYSPSYFE